MSGAGARHEERLGTLREIAVGHSVVAKRKGSGSFHIFEMQVNITGLTGRFTAISAGLSGKRMVWLATGDDILKSSELAKSRPFTFR